MDKLSLNAGKVRCLGNIVSSKDVSSFTCLDSELSVSDGVFSLDCSPTAVSLLLSSANDIVQSGSSVSFTGTVRSGTGRLMSGQTVYLFEETPILLSCDVNVLSYADSDSATLTATYSEGSGATVKLYDASDNSLVGVMTDNGDGTYSYTYSSQGVGDVGFYAKSGRFVSETHSIEDCNFYDSSTSNKISTNYDTTNATNGALSYDSTESAYKFVVANISQNRIGTVFVKDFTVSKNVEIDYWVKLGSDYDINTQSRLGLFNSSNQGIVGQLGYWGSASTDKTTDIASLSSPTDSGTTLVSSNYDFSKSTWYHAVMRFEDGAITYKLYDANDTLLNTVTGTTSIFSTDTNKVGIQLLYSQNATIYFKNLKIKAL